MSVATLVESSIVIESRFGAAGIRDLDRFHAVVEHDPVADLPGELARAAHVRDPRLIPYVLALEDRLAPVELALRDRDDDIADAHFPVPQKRKDAQPRRVAAGAKRALDAGSDGLLRLHSHKRI